MPELLRKMSKDQYARLKKYGPKLFKNLPDQWIEFSPKDGNFGTALAKKTGIPKNTLGKMLKDLERWNAINRDPYQKGSRRYIAKTEIGSNLESNLLIGKEEDEDSLKNALERTIFGPSTRERTKPEIQKALSYLKKAQKGDDNAFNFATDALQKAISQAMINKDDTWAFDPDLRTAIIGLVKGEVKRNRLEIWLGILADIIRTSRRTYLWTEGKDPPKNEEGDLVETLDDIIDDRDYASVAAIHTLKEIRTADDRVPNRIFQIVWKGVWQTLELETRNPFVDTSAALDVFQEIAPLMSDDQRGNARKQLDEIKADENGELYRKLDGKKIKLHPDKVTRLRQIMYSL